MNIDGNGNSCITETNPWQRLNKHYTFSSLGKHVKYDSFRIMKDHLDFSLSSTYQHNKELFPDLFDVYLQPFTVHGIDKKKLKKQFVDTTTITSKRKLRHEFDLLKETVLAKRLYPEHPLIIGGIRERIHPSSVKLMNSSHHSPQTNAGYIRQDRDGNLFQY